MRRFSLSVLCAVLVSLAATGCGKDKDKVDPSITDADGDLVFADDDCDDENATVFPGANEVCDGFDNNCDGQIDEGRTTTFYADLDGDGYGDPDSTIEACTVPSGYLADALDCDDGDATTYPGADELCDARDHDCNGDTDGNAVDAPEWYFDGDGDGFGTASTTATGCTAPSQHVDSDTDCNDTNLAIYPGADELCNSVDDNCDGAIDEDSAVNATDWFDDLDGDGHGDPASAVVACNQPLGLLDTGLDCDDTDPLINPDAAEICDGGIDNDCDPATDEEVVDSTPWYPDLDDDGYGVFPPGGQACDLPLYAARTPDDCDDSDPLINPMAPERCNGLDDDCDAFTFDDDAPTAPIWYVDADNDGHGTVLQPLVQVCVQPLGYASSSDDCNDANGTIYPGAIELCDGIDNDCDPLTDEADTAIWYFDGDSDGWGVNPTANGCTPPSGYTQLDGDCDDNDPAVNPGVAASCIQDHCGTISFDETWIAPYTHVISCPVVVQGAARPVLTVNDGAEVRFMAGTSLTIGAGDFGTLVVDGAVTGALFTSDELAPAPGDWEGVIIGAADDGSVLNGMEIAYAGGNNEGALWILGSSPTITNANIHDNIFDGINIDGGFPDISGSVIQNNTGNGIDIDINGGLARGIGVNTFASNSITGSGDEPIVLPAAYVDELDASSTYAGNALDAVAILGDTVDADATWNLLDVPYRVDGLVSVEGAVRPILTISDGTTIGFAGGASLTAGVTTEGSLIVDGATLGVLMTSSAVLPNAADWAGIEIGPNDQGSVLDGVTVEFAGGNNFGGLFANGSAPVLSNVISQNNLHNGFYGASATPTITDSTFTNNFEKGVFLDAGSSLGALFTNNTLTANGEEPIWLEAASAHLLDPTSTYTGNGTDQIALIGGPTSGLIPTDRSWVPMDVPYRADGDLVIEDLTAPTLTLADGVQILFATGTQLRVGTGNAGTLEVLGTPGLGVTFTSAATVPAAGDWDGVRLNSLDGGSTLTGLVVRDAGSGGRGAIHADNADAVILDCVLRDSLFAGFSGVSSTLEMRDTTVFSNAGPGVTLDVGSSLVDDIAGPTFTNNTIAGNLTFPIVVNAASVDELDPSTSFIGNGAAPIRLRGDTLDVDATFRLQDSPYQVFSSDLIIGGPVGPTVSMEDGVVVEFDTALNVLVARTDPARLMVNGTFIGVTFTSAQVVKAPGDWGGVEIASNDLGSVLIGLTIQYGGANGKGGLYVNGASPTMTGGALLNNENAGFYGENTAANISGVTIFGNTGGGVWLDANSTIAGFTNNTITGNGTEPLTVAAGEAGALDATSSFNGNGIDAIVLTADTIDSPVTFNDLGVPYRVAGDIRVEGGPTAILTVAGGTVLAFDPFTGLVVGDGATSGRLDTIGSLSRVTFTSSQASPVAGDWNGVTLGANDLGSSLVGLTVEYGGANANGNVYIKNAIPTLDGVISADSSEHGVAVTGAAARPLIINSVLRDNNRDGLYVNFDAGLDENATPGFTGNQVTANGENALTVPGKFVKELDGSSIYTGNTGPIVLTADVLDVPVTMQALDEDFHVTGNLDVADASAPTLTIQGGVTAMFAPNVQISSGIAAAGSIDVQGGGSAVTFTSDQLIPASGDWNGIQVGANDTGSQFVGLIVEYAGNNGRGGLFLNSAPLNVLVDGSVFNNNDNDGINTINSVLELRNTQITNSGNDGVWLDPSSRLFAGVGNTFSGNTITNNIGMPLVVSVLSVEEIDPTSGFVGNGDDRIALWAGTIDEDTTMHGQDVPYLLTNGDWIVRGINDPVMTVEDGVTVEFEALRNLVVGDIATGQLQVQGTPAGVVFTSAEVVPAPGDWGGVIIGASDTGSVLQGLTIEYGGANGFGGLYVVGASPTILGGALQFNQGAGYYGVGATLDMTNTLITGNTTDGVFLDATSAVGTFSANTVTGNIGSAMVLPAALADGVDASTNYTGNGIDQVVLSTDNIDSGVTWRDLGVPYLITGDVTVGGGPAAILTVQDGVTARFDANVDLLVALFAPGMIDVQGAVSGVLFTSSAAVPARGDWPGVQIGANDLGSILDGLTVEYAGANLFGNLVFSNSSPTVTNVISRQSTSSGLRVGGATSRPAITGSVFSNNDEDGVHVQTEAGLDESATPGFANNTMAGNGQFAMVVAARFVKELAVSSSFSGNVDSILVNANNIDVDSVWRALDADYQVRGIVTVTDATGPVLTIQDGVTANFETGAGLYVAVGNAGQLNLNGGVSGIVLTSDAAAPAPGDWDGVRIGSSDQGSSIFGATIEYGGNNGVAGLWFDNAPTAVSVQNSTLTNNSNAGLYAVNTLIDIASTTSSANTGDGVFLDAGSTLEPSTPVINTFSGNLLTGNGGYPLVINASSIDELDPSSSFAGNFTDLIRVRGTTTSESQTLRLLDADYEVFSADWTVQGLAGPVLSIEDDVTVRFDTGIDLIVADLNPGALMVNGTVNGVLFTSAQPVPAPGDWGGVRIGPNDLGSVLIGLTIEYAGGNGVGGLFADRSSPTLVGGALRNNQGAGYYGASATADLSNVTISGNTGTGVFLDGASTIGTFTGNVITGNAGNAVTTTADNAGLLDGTSTFTGNTVNAIFLTTATIASPVTWADLGVPFRILGSVFVSGGPTAILTVADGVVAEFETATGLVVAASSFPGGIDVQGTVTGVTFTSAQPSPARGDWSGLQIGSMDLGSQLVGLEIAYGGANGFANLLFTDSSPTVDGVYSRESTRSGLYASGAAQPLIFDSRFEDNDEQGVWITGFSGLDESATPGFAGNTLTNNGGSPLILPARYLNELDASSSFTGNGALIEATTDVIDIDVTWPLLDEDYFVSGTLTVADPSIPTLTVEDGVVAEFGPAIGMTVGVFGVGSLDVQGGLLGVSFTSSSGLPAAGDWSGLRIGAADAGSTLTNLTVEYAGSNGRGGIWADASDPVLTGCTLSNNLNHGLSGNSAFPEIRTTLSTLNSGDGVNLDAFSGIEPGAGVTFSGNVLTLNDGYPLVVPALSVDEISGTSTYSGNGIDYVRLYGGLLAADATMRALDVSYEIFSSDLTVRGAATPVLGIADGVQVDFATGRRLTVADLQPGALIVAGGVSGVVFSSSDTVPVPGSWGGIEISTLDAGSSLTNLTVEYGGLNGLGGIVVTGSAPAMSGVVADNNLNDGIHVRSGDLDLVGSTASNNSADGIFLDAASSVTNFGLNTLAGNVGYPMVLNADDVDAIDGGSTYAGNGNGHVYVRGATLLTSAQWEALDVPYRLFASDIIVRGPTAPTWTIDDGVTIEFETLLDVTIADLDLGRMVVNGTVSGVLFTSAEPVPAPGDWGGVLVGVNDTGTTIVGLTIEYAGANGFGGLVADRSAPSISGSTFRNNTGAGYYGIGATANLTGNTFANNSAEGVFLDGTSGIATMGGNTVDSNAGNAITVPARYAGDVAVTNAVLNNGLDEIQVTGDTIDATVTWGDLGVPFHVLDNQDIVVEGGPSAIWNVADGVTVNFGTNCDVRIATGATAGRLNVVGGLNGVVFSSDKAIPTRGDWGGLEIGPNDAGSTLTALTIEYAGANGFGNIRIDGSAPTLSIVTSRESTQSGVFVTGVAASPLIQNSTFEDNDVDGLLVSAGSGIDRSGIANFTNNTLTTNGANPLTIPADFVGQLDASSSFAGNALSINITADAVETSQTWQALDEDYRVSGNVDVEGPVNPVLTISDGVTVLFEASTDMTVGQSVDDGTLIVDGTGGSGVLFTSDAAFPTAGDWRGLEIGGAGTGTLIDGLTIEYGGANNFGNIWINDLGNHQITVQNTISRLSSRNGLRQDGGIALIQNSTFSNNADHGVEVASGILDNASPPSFVGNTMLANVRSSIKLHAESVSQLDATSTFIGNGTDIEIAGGVVLSSGTWQLLDADYWVTADVDVRGALDPILTIANGVRVEMEDDTDVVIGSVDDGGLVIDGSVTPVTFTSSSALPGPGSWRGIEFGNQQFGSRINGLVIEYAGGNTVGNLFFNGLNILGTVVEVLNTTSRLSSRAGLHATNSNVWVHDSTFINNNDDGLELVAGSRFDDFSTPSFTTNVVTGNGGFPIEMHPASLGQLDASSTFTGNFDDRIAIEVGSVTEDATWQALDVPILVLDILDIEGAASPHVDILAGARFQFDPGVSLRVARNEIGSLSIFGAPGLPAVFTSSDQVTPLAGDWHGIFFGPNCVAGLSGMDETTVEYGGDNGFGNVHLDACNATLINSTFTDSSTYGINRQNGALPTMSGNSFSNNTTGDVL